ncbi:MAG: hypothetical protein HY744_14995 [Deltaproteobacteria bacterium]|nr:hypothetical protein [Deltaproteobacteria bacterium]
MNNSILLLNYSQRLSEERELTGKYPASVDKNDRWGRRVVYWTRDDGFVLASFGEDGVPESSDYGRLIGTMPQEKRRSCGDVDIDTVFNEHGMVSGCLH